MVLIHSIQAQMSHGDYQTFEKMREKVESYIKGIVENKNMDKCADGSDSNIGDDENDDRNGDSCSDGNDNGCNDMMSKNHRIKNFSERGIQREERIFVFPEMLATWMVLCCYNIPPLLFTTNYLIPHLIPLLFVIVTHPIGFGYHFFLEVYHHFYGVFIAGFMNDAKRLQSVRGKNSSVCCMERKPIFLSVSLWIGFLSRALFKMSCKFMFEKYTQMFSNLSRRYQCYIVAGSILLPKIGVRKVEGRSQNTYPQQSNRIEDLELTKDGLYNQTFVFDPRGDVCAIVEKMFPTEEEIFLIDIPHHFHYPIVNIHENGKNYFMVVMVCADSWFPEVYESIDSQMGDVPDNHDGNTLILIVPSLSIPGSQWKWKWTGYSAWTTPQDVDFKSDVNHHSLESMWGKYSVAGRSKNCIKSFKGNKVAVNCQGILQLFDIYGAGRSYICCSFADSERENIFLSAKSEKMEETISITC